ncbi:MAG: hypothetical protein ACPG4X_15480 [Pikeienuella sp.]
MTNDTTAPERIWAMCTACQNWDEPLATPHPVDHFIEYVRATALEAAQARIAELERRLGGGCDANNGGEHTVMSQGKYKYCAKCGESLRGIRFCHEPRAALEGKG